MRFSVKATALIVAPLIALTGCGAKSESVAAITEAQSISLDTKQITSPQRVIALANGSAEIIASLGYINILVGRDIASTSKELEGVPIATAGHQVVPEKILELNPDVVLIDNTTGPATAIDVIKRAGIKVAMIDEAWTLTDIAKKIVAIGEVIGAQNAAVQLVQKLNAALQRSGKDHPGVRIAFLYLRGGSAIYLLGGQGSGADSLLKHLGAIDVGAQKFKQPFSPITSEALIAANPEIILVMSKGLESVGGIDGLISLPGISQTPAGKNRAVIAVDDSLLLSFGPRTPDLLRQLSGAIGQVTGR
jgi:iron complex transport system substrate-binding protein